ncbi:hypothetical protein GJ744_004883 [Endocarpon pusillum]|uniref:Uncharacterized protein n=1 Tax=Endocarpon pusillum TaxID=364733 RepID=A0A8H7E7R2_9EURO|nr:hypothetical protein GJ744_004883 [Endocarpon pusillum]
MRSATFSRVATLMHQTTRDTAKNRNLTLLLAQPSTFSRNLTTFNNKDNVSQKAEPQKRQSDAASPQNPSYPAFSFDGLGASRGVKVVVIAGLTVLGTMETIFWSKWLWAKFSPVPEGESKFKD